MTRVLIFGATGYTGIELTRILSFHPDATIIGGSSRDHAGKTASEVFPYIFGQKDFPLYRPHDLLEKVPADVAFLALPHGEASGVIRPLLDAGVRVIDLSADSRLHDPEIYRQWYGPHGDPEILQRAVYGLPEIHREAIRKADLVANPGCYPTTVILGIAPVLPLESVDSSCPIVDAKSGISGAGRGAKITTSFCEAGEGFKPYGVIGHRHIPEMEQELSGLALRSIKVRFTPHLIPVSRGMVSTIYMPSREEITREFLTERYVHYYSSEPFVRILPPGVFPDTVRVRGSNQCHISVELDQRTGWIVIMVAIDNLCKGASGCAVQNMNIMMDLQETTALDQLSLFP